MKAVGTYVEMIRGAVEMFLLGKPSFHFSTLQLVRVFPPPHLFFLKPAREASYQAEEKFKSPDRFPAGPLPSPAR